MVLSDGQSNVDNHISYFSRGALLLNIVMPTQKIIPFVIGLVVLALLAVGYFYFLKPEPEKKGAVGAAEKVSESVPQIKTNPAEKVPEVNPLDRANPFKYNNPLR